MKKLAINLTGFILQNGMIREDEREIYDYGFQIALEALLSIIISASISIFMGMLVQGIIFFLVFIPLRMYIGGFHMNKYINCLICSCVTFTMILYIAKNIHFSPMFSLIIGVYSLCIIKLIQFLDCKLMEQNEKKYYARKINSCILCCVTALIILFCVDKYEFLMIIAETLLLVVVSAMIQHYKVHE